MMKRLWPLLLLLQACGTTGGSSAPAATEEDSLATTTEIRVYPRKSYFTRSRDTWASIIVTGGVEPDMIKCKRYRCAGHFRKDPEPGCYSFPAELLGDIGLNFFEVVIGDTTYNVRLIRQPYDNDCGEPIDYLPLTAGQREALYNTPVSNLLDGREVVIDSGSFLHRFYRSEFEQMIRLNGGVYKTQVSETTDYLLYQDDRDMEESITTQTFGAQVIFEKKFREMINTESVSWRWENNR